MTAMQILERCKQAENEKQALRNKITRYRESSTRITATLDGIGARGTSEPDKLAAMTGEIDALERRIKQRDKEYAAELAAATKLLDMLPDSECRLMTGYYVKGQTLTSLAREMSFSYGYTRSLKCRARVHLEDVNSATVNALLPPWYLQMRRCCPGHCGDRKSCPYIDK